MRVSFLVALPFDVGFAQDSTATFFDAEEPIPGYEDVRVLVTGLGPPLEFGDQPGGLRLATSLWFRRVRVRGVRPFEATERAFGDVMTSGSRTLARLRGWKARLGSPALRGIETRAVVQLSRIVLAPHGGEPDDGWFSDQFDVALSKLNEVLIAAAVVSQDAAIGPVSIAELPPLVHVLYGPIETIEPDRSLMLLNVGGQGEAELLGEEQMNHAFQVVARHHGPGHAFFPVGEALVEARRAIARGRNAHAALELSIAFELVVATTVREVGAVRGDDESRIQRVLDAGLRNVVVDHLPRLLSIDIDLDDPETPFGRWWREGYDLRNRVVHRGHRPTSAEATAARDAAQEVIAAVSDALVAAADTEELGRMLAVRRFGG